MSRGTAGLAHSVQVRLARHAKTLGVDPNLVFTRFAVERFLYRLSRSRYAERFVLKGALLLLAWLGEAIRPTRDADVLGFGDLSDDSLRAIFTEVCSVPVEPDGMRYEPASVRVAAIRPEDAYGGKRVTLDARLGAARLRVQVDVGIGDAATPEPEWLEFPSLLDLPRPRLRAYRRETAIAEKVHAMVVLGSRNSRMRDFFDMHALAERESFDGTLLASAIAATFERRRTPIAEALPVALTRGFSSSSEKQAQWLAFARKSNLSAPEDFNRVVETLAQFLAPALKAAGRRAEFRSIWPAGGPWTPTGSDARGRADV